MTSAEHREPSRIDTVIAMLGRYGWEWGERDEDGVRDVLLIDRSDRRIISRHWTITDALDAAADLEVVHE